MAIPVIDSHVGKLGRDNVSANVLMLNWTLQESMTFNQTTFHIQG